VHTADGVAHILPGGDNHREGEQDDAGDAPVEPEHCSRRSKSPLMLFRWTEKAPKPIASSLKQRKRNMEVYRFENRYKHKHRFTIIDLQ
jgi:hypothetical protein